VTLLAELRRAQPLRRPAGRADPGVEGGTGMSTVDEILEEFRGLDELTAVFEDARREDLEQSIGRADLSGIEERDECSFLSNEEEDDHDGDELEAGHGNFSVGVPSADPGATDHPESTDETDLVAGSPLHRSHLVDIPSIIQEFEELGLQQIKAEEADESEGKSTGEISNDNMCSPVRPIEDDLDDWDDVPAWDDDEAPHNTRASPARGSEGEGTSDNAEPVLGESTERSKKAVGSSAAQGDVVRACLSVVFPQQQAGAPDSPKCPQNLDPLQGSATSGGTSPRVRKDRRVHRRSATPSATPAAQCSAGSAGKSEGESGPEEEEHVSRSRLTSTQRDRCRGGQAGGTSSEGGQWGERESPEACVVALKADLVQLQEALEVSEQRREVQLQILGARIEEQERRSRKVAEDNAMLIAAARALGLQGLTQDLRQGQGQGLRAMAAS
ncbi:unnamed protein product, partial [Discosporangium mesarthrocarpum]